MYVLSIIILIISIIILLTLTKNTKMYCVNYIYNTLYIVCTKVSFMAVYGMLDFIKKTSIFFNLKPILNKKNIEENNKKNIKENNKNNIQQHKFYNSNLKKKNNRNYDCVNSCNQICDCDWGWFTTLDA